MPQQNEHKVKAGVLTLIIFGILILILFWIHFKTPIPPYPEGGGGPGMGVEVNLGVDAVGMGEPEDNPLNLTTEKIATAPTTKDEVLTSDDDEAEDIANIQDKTKKPKKEKKDRPEKVQRDEIVINQPVLNQKAMFPAQSKTSEGNANTSGQQGSTNGVSNSGYYTGEGAGSGGGSGGGAGTGVGPGSGPGISFSLEGRSPSFLKKPVYKGQSEGKVVVEITVDKNGKVTSARPGVAGSTILDEDLLQVARDAAVQSTFSPKPDATVQKGKITYHFVLQ